MDGAPICGTVEWIACRSIGRHFQRKRDHDVFHINIFRPTRRRVVRLRGRKCAQAPRARIVTSVPTATNDAPSSREAGEIAAGAETISRAMKDDSADRRIMRCIHAGSPQNESNGCSIKARAFFLAARGPITGDEPVPVKRLPDCHLHMAKLFGRSAVRFHRKLFNGS